ncbi:serine/threonine protein kinase [Emydomyces testavorans]|uniref:EKC/KEOPS complex subunit BUD32 n=1 Tax=Emydomyces testavorans TaxID=2070801 RepID=A0AAF0DIK8_9EURO|nr:serine/threonine protein kinase [Emydomyces testavorans]
MEDLYELNGLIYTEERFSRYRPGGYHPVCLGDTFKNGRYKVHHKLGFGSFATVWLANDRKQNRWVSLKILTAESSSESRELRILDQLAKRSQGNLFSKYIVQVLDHFVHQGPNGHHLCIVFELLGPSAAMLLDPLYHSSDDELLETETIFRVTKQLLKAVRFIHDAGIVHGDISIGNIVFTWSDLSNLSEEEIMEALGPPDIEPLVRRDGKSLDKGLPRYLVQRADWREWLDEDEEDIRLIDFGEAFLLTEKPEWVSEPGGMRAPEMIFGEGFDLTGDLWCAGVAIYSLLYVAPPPYFYLGSKSALLYQMIGLAEDRLPDEWYVKWERMRIEEKRKIFNMELLEQWKLDPSFERKVKDPALRSTLSPILEVIKGLAKFVPSHRMMACEALKLLEDC